MTPCSTCADPLGVADAWLKTTPLTRPSLFVRKVYLGDFTDELCLLRLHDLSRKNAQTTLFANTHRFISRNVKRSTANGRRWPLAVHLRVTSVCCLSGTCSDVAPASSPSAKEVSGQPKSSALQGDRLQEPRFLLISLPTETRAAERRIKGQYAKTSDC